MDSNKTDRVPTQKLSTSIHIKVLSGFYYIVAICLLLAGIVYCFMPDVLKSSFADNAFLQQMSNGEIAAYGGIMIVVSVLEALLACKLSKLSKWAKVVALVISILGVLWAFVALFVYQGLENLFFIILHGYFIWVLTTNFHEK